MMMENRKVSMGGLIENLARDIYTNTGMPMATAEKVMKEFWSTLQEALINDGVVKVKGLGTFKMVEVKDRESINVNNGERIIIKGYKKVSFTPDPAFTGRGKGETTNVESDVSDMSELQEGEEAQVMGAVDTDSSETVDEAADQMSQAARDKLQQIQDLTKEPIDLQESEENAEEGLEIMVGDNQDTFGGIDLLIPTPESIAEAEKEYEEAKAELEKAMAFLDEKETNYRKTYRKLAFLRTGKLVDSSLQTNGQQTENESTETPQSDSLEEQSSSPSDNNTDTTASNLAQPVDNHTEEEPTPIASEPDVTLDNNDNERSSADNVKRLFRRVRRIQNLKAHYTRRFLWIFLTLITICVLAFFINFHKESSEKGKDISTGLDAEEIVEKKDKKVPAQPVSTDDSQTEATASDVAPASQSTKSDADATKQNSDTDNSSKDAAQQKRPATYILQKGQSLTDVSVMFYGTKDSVNAIIRNNNFRNPDNVFIGTEIKLP